MIEATPNTAPVEPEIEDRLRWRAFRAFYRKVYSEEPDPVARFAKAIVASAQPVRDQAALATWLEQYGGADDGE